MAQFKCYLRTNESESSKKCFAVADSKSDAIEACKKKIRDLGNSSESETMAQALQLRGFYCVGWSSNEIEIEEV